MTYAGLTDIEIARLRQHGAEARGALPVADQAPPARPLAPLARPTHDAAALAAVRDSLAEVGRGVAALAASFERRRARATADAAREAIRAQGRAAIDRQRSGGPIGQLNRRFAEVHGPKAAPVRQALPPGFTADAGLGVPGATGPAASVTAAAMNIRAAAFWAKSA